MNSMPRCSAATGEDDGKPEGKECKRKQWENWKIIWKILQVVVICNVVLTNHLAYYYMVS